MFKKAFKMSLIAVVLFLSTSVAAYSQVMVQYGSTMTTNSQNYITNYDPSPYSRSYYNNVQTNYDSNIPPVQQKTNCNRHCYRPCVPVSFSAYNSNTPAPQPVNNANPYFNRNQANPYFPR